MVSWRVEAREPRLRWGSAEYLGDLEEGPQHPLPPRRPTQHHRRQSVGVEWRDPNHPSGPRQMVGVLGGERGRQTCGGAGN